MRQLADKIYGSIHHELLRPDRDNFVSPCTATLGAVESVYSLVSALHRLSNRGFIPPQDSAAVLDHTP